MEIFCWLGHVFSNPQWLDGFVVAAPHFHDFTVRVLVNIPLPDLDDLFGIQSSPARSR